MLALSALYVAFGHVDVVAGLLFGLKAAVLAVVFEALYRMARRTLASGFSYCVAVAAFIAIALLKLPFPLVVLLAAVAGGLRHAIQGNSAATVLGQATPGALREFTQQTLIWGGLWLLPLIGLFLAFGGGHVFVQEAAFFSKLAAVTFGGAYAALFLYGAAGGRAFRLDEARRDADRARSCRNHAGTADPCAGIRRLRGGAANLSSLPPLLGGFFGGLIALWFTFVPCFLWILAGAPFVERLRQVRWLSAMLGGITAAVVGVIANLALWFSLHVLFSKVVEKAVGPFTLPLPVWSTIDNAAVLIAGAAALLLVVFRMNMPLVLLLAACFGIALRLLF